MSLTNVNCPTNANWAKKITCWDDFSKLILSHKLASPPSLSSLFVPSKWWLEDYCNQHEYIEAVLTCERFSRLGLSLLLFQTSARNQFLSVNFWVCVLLFSLLAAILSDRLFANTLSGFLSLAPCVTFQPSCIFSPLLFPSFTDVFPQTISLFIGLFFVVSSTESVHNMLSPKSVLWQLYSEL